ncbi:hypothetical protein ACFVMC_33010 [Nocardia sp. NPDC127579]|uniref:hypothetical protein n=1 Tax=Nocardia sp. NPDC127579 TaxID=3345402 RepID=UPI00362684D4
MNSYTTRTGTVRIGQLYRDAKRDEPRTVVVQSIAAPYTDYRGKDRCEVTVAVQTAGGLVKKLITLDAARLTSNNYVLVGR